jgi:hypothetical protein
MVDFGVGNTLVVVGIGVGRMCGGHGHDWARRRGGLNVLRSIDSCLRLCECFKLDILGRIVEYIHVQLQLNPYYFEGLGYTMSFDTGGI